MAENYNEWIDLTPKQVERLARCLDYVDEGSAATIQFDPDTRRIVLTADPQQWKIGPRGGWF